MVEFEVRLKLYPMYVPVSVRDIHLIRSASVSYDNIGIRSWAAALLDAFERSGSLRINSEKEYIAYLNLVVKR